ncbi:asialoglycoprotein receptor-like 1 [Triplophysa rosa]|uniref:asialoglycoprotein receptor-like 1 n=1 Tax=Triplophysa rosa TaxID=992332 RepID=UPI002545D4F2|nr:asialoglycoprotein receptor-like 1 [Triplophysa rosa]
MESIAYDRFSSSEAEINHTAPKFLPELGRQNRKMYIICGVLALYMLILTVAVGIKLSQVSQEVADVTLSLKTIDSSIKEASNPLQFEIPLISPELIVQGPCEENWVFFKDSCYFQSTIMQSWQSAENNCIRKNAHLVVVNNLEELDFLSSIVKLQVSYWIGLVEKEQGQWSWVDGTDFKATKHYWDEGQPDNWDVRVNGEDCGQLHARIRADKRRLWNDADCTLACPYICEGKPKSQ